jgi:hypothetical protein
MLMILERRALAELIFTECDSKHNTGVSAKIARGYG